MSGGGSGKKPPKKMSYRDRQAITYDQGADPPFLAQMKKQLGYKEYTVEDKFKDEDEHGSGEEEEDPALDRDDIRNMTEEERPQIVVLNPGVHMSSEQLEKEIEKKRQEEDKRKIMEGRITFKKPEKRLNEESPAATGTSNNGEEKEDAKRQKRGEGDGVEQQRRKEADAAKKQQQLQHSQNKRLISFGDEDEDE